ncbi:MAG: hypothetical protein AAF362_03290 [Pseudomonadota bacterium]
MKKTIVILAASAVLAAMTIPTVAHERGWKKGNRAMEHSKRYDRGIKTLKRADANRDGRVTIEELDTVTEKRFSRADANGDDVVTKAEMVVAIEMREKNPRKASRAGTRADRIFFRFDLNNDGKLVLEEIQNRTRKQFALLDRNDDGAIARNEIRRMRGDRHKKRRGYHKRSWYKHQRSAG